MHEDERKRHRHPPCEPYAPPGRGIDRERDESRPRYCHATKYRPVKETRPPLRTTARKIVP